MKTELTALGNWNILRKFLFRFFAVYFFLYIFPFPLDLIPHSDVILQWYSKFWDALVFFSAKSIFHISYPVENSGDSISQFTSVLIIFGVALIAAIIWTIADRKRKNYDLLFYWLRVYIRYFLAVTMLSYGAAKIFKYQFPAPGPWDLMSPLGNFAPMQLAWIYMGYSYSYNIFLGIAEAAGALLLFFKRSTTLGAFILIGVLSNVVMMNFCYDIYVKLESSCLLLMAIFLVIPDIKKLCYFFFLHRSASLRTWFPEYTKKRIRITLVTFKAFFILYVIIYSKIIGGLELRSQYGDAAPKSALHGAYKVEVFVSNKDTLPPLGTDSLRWDKLAIQGTGFAVIRKMDGSVKFYGFRLDEKSKSLNFKYYADTTQQILFTYQRPDSSHLILYTSNDSVYIKMKKIDFELENHKTKFINNDHQW